MRVGKCEPRHEDEKRLQRDVHARTEASPEAERKRKLHKVRVRRVEETLRAELLRIREEFRVLHHSTGGTNDELKGRKTVTGSLLEVPEDDGALRDVVLFVVVVATHAMRDGTWNNRTPSVRASVTVFSGELKLRPVPLYFFDECADIGKRLHIFECGKTVAPNHSVQFLPSLPRGIREPHNSN